MESLSHFFCAKRRSSTGISAKAQRKLAREIKTIRAFGLMPFTTMGTKRKYGSIDIYVEHSVAELVLAPMQIEYNVQRPVDGVENPGVGIENPVEGVENPGDGIDNEAEGVENPRDGIHDEAEGVENPRDGIDDEAEGVENPGDGVNHEDRVNQAEAQQRMLEILERRLQETSRLVLL
ncbi:Ribosomal protein S18 [Corchorus capsularis]|uniref:Small ribosomal subunit protein bS18c n=1 Tax=Corchorus capsularis TaxID=210143 RepID=A0A1R3GJ86_COCAP|nr:Ribosomal protein S18 [Corchorus capsularis]